MKRKNGLAIVLCTGAVLLSGCSQSGTPSSADSPAEGSASSAAPADSPAEGSASSAAPSASPSLPTLPPVTVVVVSTLPEKSIKSLMEDYGVSADGACQMALGVVLDQMGPTVELEPIGQPVVTARFEPSPVNGDQLPCRLEATFDNVPAGLNEYAMRLIGGSFSGVYDKTVTWTLLKEKGNTITIE